MRPIYLTSYGVSVVNGICLLQDQSVVGNLTLNGAFVTNGIANLTVNYQNPTPSNDRFAYEQYRVSITSTDNLSGVGFTVNGFDACNVEVSESLAGPTAGAHVETTQNFAIVTSIVTDTAPATNVRVGTIGIGETSPIPLDLYLTPFNVTAVLHPQGSTVTLQYSNDQAFGADINSISGIWFNHVDLTNKTADAVGTIISPVTAVRLKLSAYSRAISAEISQAGR